MLTSLILHHVFPSLNGYIIIVLILTVLPGPSSRSTNFDGELILRRSSSSYHFSLNNKIDFELCHTLGSNNLSLHHSFDLMSSPVDYIFMKSLDKCVVIIINLMSSPRMSIEFMMRNTILALDELCYHRPLYCLPSNTNLFVFCVIPWVPCYPAFVLLYLGILPPFMSRMSWEFYHLLRILDTINTSHHHHSFLAPCCFQLKNRQLNLDVRIQNF